MRAIVVASCSPTYSLLTAHYMRLQRSLTKPGLPPFSPPSASVFRPLLLPCLPYDVDMLCALCLLRVTVVPML